MAGIAMQGLSAAIVLTAIDKITKMISDAEALIDSKVTPAITKHITDIPNTPDAVRAMYSSSQSKAQGALSSASVAGGGPGIPQLPATIENAVVSFFEGYTITLDQLFPGLSLAGEDADAFVAAALASTIGVSYNETVDSTPAEAAFLLARKQAHEQERAALDLSATAGHRFAPGATFDVIARLHGESTAQASSAITAAFAARLAQERSDKMRLIRSQIDTRMDRVKRIQQQVADAFRLKMRARGLWINDQNAVIDATNNQFAMSAQFKARVDSLIRDTAARLHGNVVAGLEIGDRRVDIGKIKMMNGQELVDMLGTMVATLQNQIRGSGSYNGTERDATDWESLLA